MTDDDLRDAKLLALTESLRAVLVHLRNQDERQVGFIAAMADDFIAEAKSGSAEVTKVALAYRRQAVFKPFD